MIKKILFATLGLYASIVMAAVDINKATEAELDGIKGVGPSTTQLIVSERKKSAFKDWDDLIARVKGIGPARATKLSKEGLTVAGAPFKGAAAAASDKPAKPGIKEVKDAKEAKK
ncbi:MAG TPA: helix-hairpin-helix domain-containing protein [Ramlibacter sp.]|nr:helix-hairpin-helix domain-containing protein [Ramlibacter sp.]